MHEGWRMRREMAFTIIKNIDRERNDTLQRVAGARRAALTGSLFKRMYKPGSDDIREMMESCEE